MKWRKWLVTSCLAALVRAEDTSEGSQLVNRILGLVPLELLECLGQMLVQRDGLMSELHDQQVLLLDLHLKW